MTRLLVLLVTLLLAGSSAGCGESTQEEWGGYTEGEAKDLLKDPEFRRQILTTAPPTASGNIAALYPTNEEIDDADLRKATVQGDEAWEYRRELEEGGWCIYVAEDPETESFITYVNTCYSG